MRSMSVRRLECDRWIRVFATFRHRRTGDHERDLAKLEFRLFGSATSELGERPAIHAFVKLLELPSDGGLSLATEGCGTIVQHLLNAMGRLKKHERARLEHQRLQSCPPLPCFGRQKTFETKTIRRDSRDGERRCNSRGPRDRPDFDARRGGTPYKIETRIGQQRSTSVAHESDHLARQQSGEQRLTSLTLVVRMKRNQGFLQSERREQLSASPGVLGRHDVGGRERITRPRRYIGQIADRRCYHVEPPARRSPASHYNRAPCRTARGHRARLRSGIQSAPTEPLTGQTPPPGRLEHLE